MADFDKQKCQLRNRIAAKRDGVNAAPVMLSRLAPEPYAEDLAASYGKLPKGDDAILAAINARRVGGEPLAADQVWFRYMEACNDNFVADRYLFLDGSTLRNVARDAESGFAFMNSHRTGGMSHQTELPFGWTFAGRYEETEGRKRCILGVYMLRGVKPNGDSGPSTDDLAAMIDAGTTPDVSVGLYGGSAICDVCGEDLHAYDPDSYEYLCPHVPGTTYAMTAAQQKAQKGRGVQDGCCSYSLTNARCGEVSSVYDGAVPGAGFRKALSLSAKMDDACRLQASQSYRALSRSYDFTPGEREARTALPFSDHSESALTAVEELLARFEAYVSMRQDRPNLLSAERRADAQRMRDVLDRLLSADNRPDPNLQARLRSLRLSQIAQQVGL